MAEIIHCIPGALSKTCNHTDWLRELYTHGATGIRLFLMTCWNKPQPGFFEVGSPFIVQRWVLDTDVPEWDLHGGVLTPVFREEWNAEYFDLLGKICAEMKSLGMKLHASLTDFCTWKLPGSYAYYGRTKGFNQWWHFRMAYGGGRLDDGTGGVIGSNLRPFWAKWVQKIIPFLQETGVEFDVETCNEYAPWQIDFPAQQSIDWHNWFVDEVIAAGVPIERIYFSGDEMPETIGIYSKMKSGYICHHGISNPGRYNLMWYNPEECFPLSKRFLSNDGGGGNLGNDGPIGIYGRIETGIGNAEAIADKILNDGEPGFEFLSHSVDFPGEDAGNGPWGYLGGLKKMGEKFGTIPEKVAWTVCSESGMTANSYCPNRETKWFWPWEELPALCDIHKEPTPEPTPPEPEPKEEKMNIFKWLFGKNSFYQKHPRWVSLIIGFVLGFILKWIL
jgi:hypothetical protein